MPSSLFSAQFLACSLGPPLARSSGDSRSLIISRKTLMHPEYPGKRNTHGSSHAPSPRPRVTECGTRLESGTDHKLRA